MFASQIVCQQAWTNQGLRNRTVEHTALLQPALVAVVYLAQVNHAAPPHKQVE